MQFYHFKSWSRLHHVVQPLTGLGLVASVFVLHITSPSDGSRIFHKVFRMWPLRYFIGPLIRQAHRLSFSRDCVWLFLRPVRRVNTLFNPKRLLFLILIFNLLELSYGTGSVKLRGLS